MATKEQSVTLLRRNKRAQVAALQAGGFSVTEGSRAADFGKYVKWGAGLLDVTIYAVRISDGQAFYFTKEEWGELTLAEKNLFVKGGVRVRAHGKSFILAPDKPDSMTWSAAQSYCESYKAHTAEDGVEDPLTWRMPDRETMKIVYRHYAEINEVYVAGWSSDASLPAALYWTSEQASSSTGYYLALMASNTFVNTAGVNSQYRFRPVSIQNV